MTFQQSPWLVLLLIVAGRFKANTARAGTVAWDYDDVIFAFLVLCTGLIAAEFSSELHLGHLEAGAFLVAYGALVNASAIGQIVQWKYGLPFAALGLGRENAAYYAAWAFRFVFGTCTLLGALGCVLVLLFAPSGEPLWTVGQPAPGSQLELFLGQSKNAKLVGVVYCLGIVLAMPIVEEMLFRGFLIPTIVPKFGVTGAITFSALIWGLGHGSSGLSTLHTFLVGLVYGYLYRRTSSIVPSIVLHVCANVFLVLLLPFALDFERPWALLLPLFGVSAGLTLWLTYFVRRWKPLVAEQRLLFRA